MDNATCQGPGDAGAGDAMEASGSSWKHLEAVVTVVLFRVRSRSDSTRWICQSEWVLTSGVMRRGNVPQQVLGETW